MPTGRQIHIDTPLSGVLVAAFETLGDFVAPQLFPPVPVQHQSDKYYTLKKESWLRQPVTYRAPRAAANRLEFDISSDSFFCDNYALTGEIPIEDLVNADPALRIRETTTQLIARGLLADLEIRAAAVVAANVSTTVRNTGADAWDATTSADIQTQVHNGHISIFTNTGLRANTLVVDYQSYLYMKRNALIFTKFQYRNDGGSLLSDAQLKEALMVDNIWVARSQKNNANPAATASITSIWGATALLARVEPGAPSMQTATYGLGFRWTEPSLGTPMAVTTRVEDGAGTRHIELLEGGYFQDEKVVASALGFLINTKSGTPW